MSDSPTSEPIAATPANRLGLSYEAEASKLGAPAAPIIDIHSHLSGEHAAAIHRRVMDLYGVDHIFSMTQLEHLDAMRSVFGDRISFIAVPNHWAKENRKYHMGDGYSTRIRDYHREGVEIVKFWCAPRAVDFATEIGDPGFMRLDAPNRIRAMDTAAELGMMFMAHIADPDTWFLTKYQDASVYGSKAEQYEVFEQTLDRYPQQWIAAHMGGWPENLEFLSGLLDRHDNLSLDTSATKWMVRELSKQPREELLTFLRRWERRILFGSDVVTTDDHLTPATDDGARGELLRKASSPEEAFDLYASRYWALRTMFETQYDGDSPIADPDLAMVDPGRFSKVDAPRLQGKAIPADILKSVYRQAAERVLQRHRNATQPERSAPAQ